MESNHSAECPCYGRLPRTHGSPLKLRTMNLFIYGSSLILALFILCEFSNGDSLNGEDQIILRVGDIKISEYIYKRERERQQRNYNRNESDASAPFNEELWRAKWIDKLLFVCEARKMGYARHEDVLYATKVLSKHMLISNLEGPYARYLVDRETLERDRSALPHERIKIIQELYAKETKQILTDSNIRANEISLDRLLSQLSKLDSLEKPLIIEDAGLGERTLFEYANHSETRSVSIFQFIDHHNERVISNRLDTLSGLEKEIDNMVVDLYRIQKAETLKLSENTAFRQEKENFVNNTIYNIYNSDLLNESIDASNGDLEDYFNRNALRFQQSKEIQVISITGRERHKVRMAANKIRKRLGNESEIEESMFRQFSGENIRLEKKTLLVNNQSVSNLIEKGILKAPVGKIILNGKNEIEEFEILLKIGERGTFVPDLHAILPEVRRSSAQKHLASHNRRRLEELREIYTVRSYL